MRSRERLLVFLGVCLPVPLFAATGLSLPLPGTVERLATRLVPFSERAAAAPGGVAGGSIVLTDAERRQARIREVVVRASSVAEPAAAPSARRLTQRPAERTATGARRSDDAESTPIESRVAPEPPPVALPPLTPPGPESKPGRGPKPKLRPADGRKPRPEPAAKSKQKPKRTPPPKPKTEPAPPPKRELRPQPPKLPKPPKEPADEPQPPRRGAGAEQDNGEDGGKP